MPIRDAAARRKSVRNDYGTDRASDAPASHQVALFNGDPMTGGVEVTGPGYARTTVLPADWVNDPDDPEKVYATATFPAPTGEWAEATHWALLGSDALWWDCAPFDEPLVITGAGVAPVVRLELFYADAITELEE